MDGKCLVNRKPVLLEFLLVHHLCLAWTLYLE